MSQRDLARELRAARPLAPPAVRERVRLIAAQAAPPRHRAVTRRRALAVALPVAAALVAAAVVATRPSHHAAQIERAAVPRAAQKSIASGHAAAAAPVPSPSRVQRYTASLELRVPSAAAVSSVTKRALAISRADGGYAASVSVDAGGTTGYASLRLRIPKPKVEDAVRRISALGRILDENVNVQDLQTQVDATDRLIARLQRQLATLRTEVQTPDVQQRIAGLTARVERLQRARASTLRSARYATLSVQLSSPSQAAPAEHHHGPLHGLGTAFRWLGIGAVYALAIGTPLALIALLARLAVRTVRRRREDALLSRP